MLAPSSQKTPVRVAMSIGVHSTPLGEMWSRWTTNGLYRLGWQIPGNDELDCEPSSLSATTRREMDQFDRILENFFRDGRESFLDVRVDPTGWTPFRARVYEQCRRIKPGTTCTYKQLAAMAGSEKASRAVGSAMAQNRVPLVIPCHRVVSTGGGLCGFSAPGGLETKRFLLDLERPTLL